MSNISRRAFLQRATVGTAVAGLAARGLRLYADPLGIPIGVQTYPERDRIAQGQFVQLLKDYYTAGIRQIELCSPGYAQFASLSDGKQTKQIIADSGLRCISSHANMNEYRTKLRDLMQWAQDLGLTQIGCASLGGTMTDGRTSLNNVLYATEEYNRIGAQVHSEGIQLFLHNENYEDSVMEDGRLTYPVLLEYLDPNLVKMQFQMSGMVYIGDPIMYFRNNPGRFISAHLHGVSFTNLPAHPLPLPTKRAGGEGGRGAGRGRGRGTPPPQPPGIAMGDDDVDWPRVFAAAKIGGMTSYFIEQESSNGWDCMVKDIAYLHTINV